jgi:hypothetical protein
MNPILSNDVKPDYFIAQFPGGGQRGFATVLLLDWFEKKTGLPTHQLFPYVTTGSVGILIASALYLPHPEHSDAARMSAGQLVDAFPKIAVRTPKKAAIFTNKNDRQPFADVIHLFIGDAKLKDLLGTVFFSSHEIGGASQSHKTPSKIIHPETGEVTYDGDPESRILDYALAGTALPAVFTSYQGQIDLAFANSYSDSLYQIKQLFNHTAKGAFIRVGNFRDLTDKSSRHLNEGGMSAMRHIMGAISDGSYAQTLNFATICFGNLVFNLEQEIPQDYPNPPAITANVTSPEQFKKIRVMTEKYIEDNIDIFESLALALKEITLERIAKNPGSTFGILPKIQEFPLPEIPDLEDEITKIPAYSFGFAAGKLVRGIGNFGLYSLRTLFAVATSPPMLQLKDHWVQEIKHGWNSIDEKLLPPIPRKAGDNLTLPHSEQREPK